jgi:hypothetical protein
MAVKQREELSGLERDVVSALIETKAVNFEALGAAIAKFGPISDAKDLYQDRASFVNVGGWPAITEAWEQFHLGSMPDLTCEEVK